MEKLRLGTICVLIVRERLFLQTRWRIENDLEESGGWGKSTYPRLDLFQIAKKSSLLLYDPFYNILNGVDWGRGGGFLNSDDDNHNKWYLPSASYCEKHLIIH